MTANLFDRMTACLADTQAERAVGTVLSVTGAAVRIGGLQDRLRQGDNVVVRSDVGPLAAAVVRIAPHDAEALVDGPVDGIAVGDRVLLLGRPRFAPDESWIGRVIDPDGRPLDGGALLPGVGTTQIRQSPPAAHQRRGFGERLDTGLAVMNTVLPLVRGQRMGLFAGSGVGKSTLLADLAKGVTADVIVIALVGERGRELREFTENVLGPEGMSRTVVVAATSDRAPQVRRKCAWAATAVAEYFRDKGLHVLLLVDSVTRFCEAHREISVVAGELANLRGYPASTGQAIAGLCERAGPGGGQSGDITAIYTVLVAGSDMEEPVADMLRGVLDGHIVLDRAIAEKGHFPAIDVLRSVSRSLPSAASRVENSLIAEARRRLSDHAAAAMMIQAGLYTTGTDQNIDNAVACHEGLQTFLQLKDKRATSAHFVALTHALAPGRV